MEKRVPDVNEWHVMADAEWFSRDRYELVWNEDYTLFRAFPLECSIDKKELDEEFCIENEEDPVGEQED